MRYVLASINVYSLCLLRGETYYAGKMRIIDKGHGSRSKKAAIKASIDIMKRLRHIGFSVVILTCLERFQGVVGVLEQSLERDH
jgi:cobalamin biosynthesis Co2+ chelatase CbiK